MPIAEIEFCRTAHKIFDIKYENVAMHNIFYFFYSVAVAPVKSDCDRTLIRKQIYKRRILLFKNQFDQLFLFGYYIS